MQSTIDETVSPATGEAAATKPAGWGELFSGRTGIYAFALAGGVTLHAVNMYIATTVMPSVVAEIGGLDFYAWATTLFVVASILGAALTARLLKVAGPRGAYVAATMIFAAGTLVSSLAINMPIMLVGRALQGVGGGFLYALAYGLTRLVLPERFWGRVIGLISAMFGVATLVGPAIGGMFAQYGAWRAAFWSLLPFTALFAVLAFATLPRSSPDRNERSPVPAFQLLLLTGAILSVSAGSLASELLWQVVGLGASLLMIGCIAAVDKGAKARLLPRRSFIVSTPLGALYLVIVLLMFAMQPEIYVPYLLQHLHGQSPLIAGYLAALMAIGWTVASFLSSRWQESGGDRLVLAGPVLTLAGLALLAIFLPIPGHGDWSVLAPVCLGLTLIGFGIGLAWPSLVTRVYRSAPSTEQDLAAGGMTTVQLFAIAFGTACAGLVANMAGITATGNTEGISNAALWLCVIFALSSAIAIPMARNVNLLTRHNEDVKG